MEANASKFEALLSANKTQFIIPVYQRNYDWTSKECTQLLNDILHVGNDSKIDAHFLGSIVFIQNGAYTTSKIKELTVIDGQQRLTTLTLIYLAIYRLARELEDEELTAEIEETYLINKFASGDLKFKLRPTENNDKAIKYLFRADTTEEYHDYSRIIINFNYFKENINKENYQKVLDGLSKLMIVEISLERKKDNPQMIFESLNSTGLDLSQADLIRNYILMGLEIGEQTEIFENFWAPIEQLAKNEISQKSLVSDFIRDYLTLINKKIPAKKDVYTQFKKNFPTTTLDKLKEQLQPIKSLARFYNKLNNPINEIDKEVRINLEYINRLEIKVVYPFLMKVYEDYDNQIIEKSEFIELLNFVQSFTWRRFIVGLPTNTLNKLFMIMYDKIDKNNYLVSLQEWLLPKLGRQRFPKDQEVIEILKSKDLYNINTKNRTYLLERLENYQNSEPVVINENPDITVEHIFPQNPEAKWKIDLGNEEYKLIKENYLNTLANLTLTGYNSKLSNKSFQYKRDLENGGFKSSRLWLNSYLSQADSWNLNSLKERFEILSKRFLQIWSYPSIVINTSSRTDAVNIFEADTPLNKKLDYAIFFDEKIIVKEVSKLYREVFRQLFELQPEIFFNTELGDKITLTDKENNPELRQGLKINDSYYIEGNKSNVAKFDCIKKALNLFGCQDELFIKYANS